MTLLDSLAWLVERSQRHALIVMLAAGIMAGAGAITTARHLGINTNTNLMFPESLPWRHNAIAFMRDFPQFSDLLVAVVDGRIPEATESTAADLAAALAQDHTDFKTVHRPDSSPFLSQEGLLFLDTPRLEAVLDRIIGAQPFLGELAADQSARGLFAALSLLGRGATQSRTDLGSFLPALTAFHQTMAEVIDGHSRALSWSQLLGGQLVELADQYKFVLVQPTLDFSALEPGGAAAQRMRQIIEQLPLVKSGDARVRITGVVALADDEFATVARGIVAGLIGSIVLITLWLFLAVRSWRLIVPILLTLGLGLLLTLLFATLAVGTLNLVSVGFGILFVGIAVDFAIQFAVRYRQIRHDLPDIATALTATARRAGGQILVASGATAAGFLAFVPTEFRGVAELGLIAGIGMLIAFCCTLFFLPAAIRLFHPPSEPDEIGFRWAEPLDDAVRRYRRPLLLIFAMLGAVGLALLPQLRFDADPLHTKDPTTEAMQTLYDLIASPITNPFTVDIIAPSVADAAAEAPRLATLPLVAHVLSLDSFVPADQPAKLALIDDARTLLEVTLAPRSPATPPSPDEIRQAATDALAAIEPSLAKLPADHPLAEVAGDLRRLSVASDPVVRAADEGLTRFLPMEIEQLRVALTARTVTAESLPPEITRDWLLPDGRARLQVVPKPATQDSVVLQRFVDQVKGVAPDAGGAAVIFESTGTTIVNAFRAAALTAIGTIALILLIALRRIVDTALVIAPLLLSALATVVVIVALRSTLNYANIIALPLLLGVGVSFNVYFIMNWRMGQTSVLGSATARAILYSALTTASAFGALALSAHPGTAAMGRLLLISLGCTLISSLVFVPALLATVGAPRRFRRLETRQS
ncbi:MAG TPA: MMPL family transporter [Stellaceae bacterium]|nr:MMPL family transporter [Stellaceae bacterium]